MHCTHFILALLIKWLNDINGTVSGSMNSTSHSPRTAITYLPLHKFVYAMARQQQNLRMDLPSQEQAFHKLCRYNNCVELPGEEADYNNIEHTMTVPVPA